MSRINADDVCALPPALLALDLSITATGIAFPDGSTATLRPVTKGDDRLDEIATVIGDTAVNIDLVVIEGPVVRSNAAVTIGMVHGAVRRELIRRGRSYVEVPPATLKKYATGKGNASKPDMRMALYQRAGLDIDDDNQVDAWWLRAAALDAAGHAPFAMPKAQRDALDKVHWPWGVAE